MTDLAGLAPYIQEATRIWLHDLAADLKNLVETYPDTAGPANELLKLIELILDENESDGMG